MSHDAGGQVEEYEIWEPADFAQHFHEAQETGPDINKGRVFKGWNGIEYTCAGHFSCGYHMIPRTPGAVRRHCISERAMGRTYHEVAP